MPVNPSEFQKSITNEIDIIKNRVRNIIGSAHWGEEGRYKEAVLKNVIKKFLPSNLSVGSGFIVQGNSAQPNEVILSTQLDIIVYDNTYPLLFSEGDLIITTQSNVRALVEVKTKVVSTNGQKNSLSSIMETFNDLSKFEIIANKSETRIFKGLFAYEYSESPNLERLDSVLRTSNGMVNHICLGKDIFIRHWNNADGLIPAPECDGDFYNVYRLPDLSYSYFISNLIKIACNKEMNERDWFLFPIEGTKETKRIHTVCLNNNTRNIR